MKLAVSLVIAWKRDEGVEFGLPVVLHQYSDYVLTLYHELKEISIS